jgi:hypothetical protein
MTHRRLRVAELTRRTCHRPLSGYGSQDLKSNRFEHSSNISNALSKYWH